MVKAKSMTGFPRDSESDSESGASEEEPSKTVASKSAKAVRKQAVGVRPKTNGRFKLSSRARAGPCVREPGSKKGLELLSLNGNDARVSCSVVLPSGLRDVSSVVIVFDAVFGPRLRRILDKETCDDDKHERQRREELYAVSVSRTRTSGAIAVRVSDRGCMRARTRAHDKLAREPTPWRVLRVHSCAYASFVACTAHCFQDVCTSTVYVDSTCSKCLQCFFVQDPEKRQEPTADLGLLLSALCL